MGDYDDFIAIAEDLIARRITTARRLGIEGGSNGGLLMGVMLTQRPELFRAAVIQVPLLDMLRFDKLLAGALWVDEYGSPQVPEERAWLERMSPYQNLRRRDDFPPVFILTSTKDDRVHPGHARKYAARLEALGMPFLYYENTAGGHSAAADLRERARRLALEFVSTSRGASSIQNDSPAHGQGRNLRGRAGRPVGRRGGAGRRQPDRLRCAGQRRRRVRGEAV